MVTCDLCIDGTTVFQEILRVDSSKHIVYSDPPWNPGNEKWWRRHAKLDPPIAYDRFLDAWCECVALCNATHIFCEQSINQKHRQLMLAATERCKKWQLPLIEEWTVFYGNPRRPNTLMHFGNDPLKEDPSGLNGETMVAKVFGALPLTPGDTIVDPCIGLGTTSRQAHKHGFNCIGSELNPKRLERTIAWLTKHGYCE